MTEPQPMKGMPRQRCDHRCLLEPDHEGTHQYCYVLGPQAGADASLRDEIIAVLVEQTPTAVYGDGTIKIVAEPVADALMPAIERHLGLR